MSAHLIEFTHSEEARLNALRDLRLLDTPPSESFDRLTRLASRLLSAPVSTISLTDRDRQWFKSKFGVELTEIPREQAPCNYAIQKSGVFIVPDLKEDPRFSDSVLAQAGIRFYAGAPLHTRAGHGLGTLCVVDVVPRTLDADQQQVLTDLAGMVMSQIELQNMIGRVDGMSGLANQNELLQDLEDLGRRAPGQAASGIVIDLVPANQASQAWRALGADYADTVVCGALRLIQQAIGDAGRLYHIGSTRGAIILSAQASADPDMATAHINAALSEPIVCNGIPVNLHPAVGTYSFKAAEEKPRDTLRRMFSAVEDARHATDGVATYNPASDLRHARSFILLNDFKAAMADDDQLSLFYQPRIWLATGRCDSAEALLRWQHLNLGSISPAEFVPAVEQTALIRPMTSWVARKAVAQLRDWKTRGLALSVSINVSAANLDEADFAERLLGSLAEAGLGPDALELEFTETAIGRDNERGIAQLRSLRDAGMQIAIDDFGSGYSNLSYLQSLPASILKIDRAFVQSLESSQRNQTLVRTMIVMAHDLGYRVVAEGIETPAAYEMLAEWGCDEGQGFHMALPMPAQELTAWLARQSVISFRKIA